MAPSGQTCPCARRARLWHVFEYLERLFGYGPRIAGEKLRVATALGDLPALRGALAAGELPWSAVRELTRVVVPETEAEWLDAARGMTVREIERMVSGHRPGDLPSDPADPSATRRVLRFEVSGDTYAAMREARSRLELEVGHALDDDALLGMLAQRVLGGAGDEGRAPYQIALTVCERCGRGTRDGSGVPVPIEPARLEAAQCDAQHVGDPHVGRAVRAAQTVAPRVRRQVRRRDQHRCRVPGCRSAKYLEVHHIVPRSEGGANDPSNLILICTAHHAAAHEGTLRIEVSDAGTVRFSHADGTRYGRSPVLRSANVVTATRTPSEGSVARDAVGALHRLGFKRTEASHAVAKASKSTSGELLDLVREALAILGKSAVGRAGPGQARGGEP